MSKHFVNIPDTFEEAASTLTNQELVEKYKVGISIIAQWRRLFNIASPIALENKVTKKNASSFPDPNALDYRYSGILRLDGNCIITSDWHNPFYDIDFADKMMLLARKKKIKQIAIVGDLFDAMSLSRFDPQDAQYSVQEELETTREIIVHLAKWFDRIYWSLGNHEMRFLRALKFQLNLNDVGKLLFDNPKLITTQLTYMQLHSGGENWRLIHPKNYSIIPCRVSGEVAELQQTNVMGGHVHLFGMKTTKSGLYTAIDLGGMFDPHKITYVNAAGDATNPIMAQGFWILEDGVPTGYTPKSNWNSIL